MYQGEDSCTRPSVVGRGSTPSHRPRIVPDVVEIEFAKAFRRHVECPGAQFEASTVRAALDAYFDRFPSVRSYVVDDAGAVRKHVAIFLNDDLIVDRATLADAVVDGDRLHVFQALSGGCT